MAEFDFERSLERMFADTRHFADSAEFADRVEGRLDRGWALRGWLIGAAGIGGGVIGASQLILSNFVQRIEQISAGSSELLKTGYDQIQPGLNLLALAQSDWTVVWMAGGMAVLALAFVLSRVIEEI